MKQILNLAYPAQSEIPFKLNRYPDGQQDITIQVNQEKSKDQLFDEYKDVDAIIYSRMKGFQDIELIFAATKALRRLKVHAVSLYSPYLLGARSDREFVKGGLNYLSDVLGPVLNPLNLDYIKCIDAHSDVSAAVINNLISLEPIELVEKAIDDLKVSLDDVVIVAPDAGASKKIFKLFTDMTKGSKMPEIVIGAKERDLQTGNIVRSIIPVRDGQMLKKDWIIVDDICDGGRTFIEIARFLRSQEGFTGRIFLIVSHGIFSNGLFALSECIDGIYCYNSYSNYTGEMHKGLIFKQFNCFSNEESAINRQHLVNDHTGAPFTS